MSIIIASVILGVIALLALYWPKAKAGKGEVIVRLYKDQNLLVTRVCECDITLWNDKAVVSAVHMPNMKRSGTVNRITLAVPTFSDFEVEIPDIEQFDMDQGCDLTIVPHPDEIGVLVIR